MTGIPTECLPGNRRPPPDQDYGLAQVVYGVYCRFNEGSWPPHRDGSRLKPIPDVVDSGWVSSLSEPTGSFSFRLRDGRSFRVVVTETTPRGRP